MAELAANKPIMNLLRKKAGQATVEYILLIVVVSIILTKVLHHIQEIFYGWGSQKGAIVLFIDNQVVNKLSTTTPGWI